MSGDESGQSSPVVLGGVLVLIGHVAVVVLALQWITCPRTAMFCAIPEAVQRLAFLQLVYVVPLFWWARRSGRREMAKGVIIMAALTVLLSGMCWLLV